MTSAKNIINFQFTIYMCIPLFFHPVKVNRPWRDGWMIGRMWSIISSIYPIIAGLWHVCDLFLLLSLPCRVCIPLNLCPVKVNRPWRDGWMDRWRDKWMKWCFTTSFLYFLLFSPWRCVCIPLFLCTVEVNKPWRDRWMIGWMDGWMMGQMDEMMLHDVLSCTIFLIVFSAMPRLYSILSSPHRNK